MTLHVRASDTLEAITKTNASVHRYGEIGDSDFGCDFEVPEEVHPVLLVCVGAKMLFPGHYIKHDKTFIRDIILHHCINIAVVKSCSEIVFKFPDCCFVVRCCCYRSHILFVWLSVAYELHASDD